MLPAYIIEELRNFERERAERERPQIQLELPLGPTRRHDSDVSDSKGAESERGVSIISVWGD